MNRHGHRPQYLHGCAGDGSTPRDELHRFAVSDVSFPWLLELISLWKVANAAPFSHRADAARKCAGNSRWHFPRSSAHRGTRRVFYYRFCSFSSIIHISLPYCMQNNSWLILRPREDNIENKTFWRFIRFDIFAYFIHQHRCKKRDIDLGTYPKCMQGIIFSLFDDGFKIMN